MLDDEDSNDDEDAIANNVITIVYFMKINIANATSSIVNIIAISLNNVVLS